MTRRIVESKEASARRSLLHKNKYAVSVLLVGTALMGATPCASAQTSGNASDVRANRQRPADRALSLVNAMTLDEKISLVTGTGSSARYSRPGISRLGIPPYQAADGPNGLRTTYGTAPGQMTTALPSGLALASSFNSDLAFEYGKVIGREAYALGYSAVLSPTSDIARVPNSGRNFESFGEDPKLVGATASEIIKGIQKSPVVSGAKHYAAYNQEFNRSQVNGVVDERTLREIYTRYWGTIVKEGQPLGVLAALNSVNGEYLTSNYHLLTEILKDDLQFQGYVQSDFDADHATTDANAGLDIEDPDPQYFGAKLKDAVQSGIVPMARLDDMVYRYVRALVISGWIDKPSPIIYSDPAVRGSLPAATLKAGDRIARQVGDEGIVLLKNDGAALPLSSSVRSIALIGADLDINITGGGSAFVSDPGSLTTTLQGITDRAAKIGATVKWTPGVDTLTPGDMMDGAAPIPSSVLHPFSDPTKNGLDARYYASGQLSGTPYLSFVEPQVNRLLSLADTFPRSFPKAVGLNPGAQPLAAIWLGTLTAPSTGDYTFSLYHFGGARLVINANVLIAASAPEPKTDTVVMHLTAGQVVAVEVNYWEDAPASLQNGNSLVNGGAAKIRLGWIPPKNTVPPNIAAAVKLAKESDEAVVVVRDYNSEGVDRANLTLPQDQNRLIEEVVKVNPRTTVVLETGGPVLMPWLSQVPSVVQAWYAGQEQGKVIADVLFGDVNPSGKLPISFPAEDYKGPIASENQYPGNPPVPYVGTGPLPQATYSEGLMVGYRGFQSLGIAPLFPFGHGLSYTTFGYSDVQVSRSGNAKNSAVHVKFRVSNAGSREGSEVAQIYMSFPSNLGEPTRQLVGWQKVTLAPNQSQLVDVTIDPTAADHPFSFWNTAKSRWNIGSGRYDFSIGSSSSDIRLTSSVQID